MTSENKKIAMYVGGAVVLGAVGFFVYSFFEKPIIVGENTSFNLGNSSNTLDKQEESPFEQTNSTKTNTFFSDLQSKVFEPIKTPNVFKSLISANPLQTTSLLKK